MTETNVFTGNVAIAGFFVFLIIVIAVIVYTATRSKPGTNNVDPPTIPTEPPQLNPAPGDCDESVIIPALVDEKNQATTQKHTLNKFNPATSGLQLSYVSGAVAIPSYNTYEPNEYLLAGYYSDWSQYDGRLDGDYKDESCGRGINLMDFDSTSIDKLIFGFIGVVGDKGEKGSKINDAASQADKVKDQITFLDLWGDLNSGRNCGFTTSIKVDYKNPKQSQVQGLMGGLRLVHEKNPKLRLAFTIGGWTMSEAFHWFSADASRRKTFCDSVVQFKQSFPMFTDIDIDWEYPNASGNTGNTYDETDKEHYRLLIGDLKKSLQANQMGDVKITIACSADPVKIIAAGLPDLIAAGVDAINLMTYDLSGYTYSVAPAHHTNLYSNGTNNQWSSDAAVNTIVNKLDIDPKHVNLGFAAYSRNFAHVELTSVSPLKGTYKLGVMPVGSFEGGVTEFYDVLYSYMDFTNCKEKYHKNGYYLFTDTVANADFLYSPTTKVLISLDTPRTVKLKGEYVRKNKLGGLFSWMLEQDRGILANAAAEGLGRKLISTKVKMTNFYNTGYTSLDEFYQATGTKPGGTLPTPPASPPVATDPEEPEEPEESPVVPEKPIAPIEEPSDTACSIDLP